MELLQPKTIFLRLNLEQAQHIIDGLYENRKYIVDESLDLYDSQLKDIIHQLQEQNIQVILPEEYDDTFSKEIKQLKSLLFTMQEYIETLDSTNYQFKKQHLIEQLFKIHDVIFGE